MSDISGIPTSQLRAAAAAWRSHCLRPRFSLFGPIAVPVNETTFDRIDEMIDEIERLRNLKEPVDG